MKPIELYSEITCPKCGHKEKEKMPEDACQHFYVCEKCNERFKANDGDCCVFCSFGTIKCPSIQEKGNCC